MAKISRMTEIRKEHGYTRERLAQILGISQYTLRNYELGINEPGKEFIKHFCSYFNISADYLLGICDEKSPSYKIDINEKKILEAYRSLDIYGKELIEIILEKEATRSSIKHLESYQKNIIEHMND